MKHKRWQAVVMIAFAWVMWPESFASEMEDPQIQEGKSYVWVA